MTKRATRWMDLKELCRMKKYIKKLYAVWFNLSKIFEMATFRNGKQIIGCQH